MIKPLTAAIGSILLASTMSATVHAQQSTPPASSTQGADADDPTELDEVIVTGTRSAKAIDKIPGAVNVVTEAEVKQTLVLTEDATAVLARTVPGYAESSQAMSNTGENLRGRIALRLFDGVPQGSPLREGTRNGTFTDMGIVGRIEVINGPSASEGIGAAGGIINYISSVPTIDGNQTTITSRYSTQFADDSEGWKLGVNFARKKNNYDVLLSAAQIDRGISYDANGRRVGMNTSGSVSDSEARNIFLKGGFNFGDNMQRIEASASHFRIEGKANYIQVLGCRPEEAPICGATRTNTSERGSIFGSKAAFNDFKQYQATYTHYDLGGGTLVLNAYKADQAMRFLPEDGDDRQIGPIPPNTRIFDQSEIVANKKGLRTSWTRPSLFSVEGLELRVGLDLVEDTAQQRLALTDRVWVPPLEYSSTAPWAQVSWDIGPVTLAGGIRREDGELRVDDYTTTYFRDFRRVGGGTLDYKENLVNAGAIWRIGAGWSVFASYGEGFTLANVGIPLRNIQCSNDTPEGTQPNGCPNDPPISVADILDLNAIVVDNREVGFNWRGSRGSLGGSYYESDSDFGQSLSIDPLTNDFVLLRAPVQIKGYELSGDYRFSDAWRFNAVYSHIRGKTSFYSADVLNRYPAGELDRPMGVLDINPDKFAWSVTWKFVPRADLTLGATTLFSRDLSGSGVRPFDNRAFTFTESTKGYTLFDLGVNYDTETFGKFSLGIENLFDKQYILSWSQPPGGFQNYWAGRGRMVSLTHTITF